MLSVVFETVQVLVALATHFATIWLFLFHPDRTGIWDRCGGIDDRKGAVWIFFELLILVAMLTIISILVSIFSDCVDLPVCGI